MRLVIDSLIVVMVLSVIGGVLYLNRQQEQEVLETGAVVDALAQLQEQARHHAAINTAVAGRETVLVQIMPHWFHEQLPINNLVGQDQPWIDLAPPGDASIHPPDPDRDRPPPSRLLVQPHDRCFPRAGHATTQRRQNTSNSTTRSTAQRSTHSKKRPTPARTPLAYTPGLTPTTSYASPAAEWVQTAGTAELHGPTGSITSHQDNPTPQNPERHGRDARPRH